MRRTRWAAMVTATAVVIIGLAPPAHAMTTVEVGGSSAPGQHEFFATASGGAYIAITHSGVTWPFQCAEVLAEGYIRSGSSQTVATIEPISRINTPEPLAGMGWNGCVAFLGLQLEVEAALPWSFHASSGATGGTTDVVDGYISGPNNGELEFRIYAPASPGMCDFTVKGRAGSRFEEGTQSLIISEVGTPTDLYVASVGSGGAASCFALVGVGDEVELQTELVLGDDDPGNTSGGISSFFPVLLS